MPAFSLININGKGWVKADTGKEQDGKREAQADAIRKLVIEAIDWDRISDDLKAVTPRERLRFISSVLNKVLPKPIGDSNLDHDKVQFVMQVVDNGIPLEIDG